MKKNINRKIKLILIFCLLVMTLACQASSKNAKLQVQPQISQIQLWKTCEEKLDCKLIDTGCGFQVVNEKYLGNATKYYKEIISKIECQNLDYQKSLQTKENSINCENKVCTFKP